MDKHERIYRRAQLWGVRASDPDFLRELYRQFAPDDACFRPNASYGEMVDAILNRQEIEDSATK